MLPPIRELRQKPEDDLNFFANYWNHCLAIRENHHHLFEGAKKREDAKMPIGSFLKTTAHIASKKLNFFDPLIDGHDYLDEFMGVTFIPVALVGLTVMASLLAALKTLHSIAIVTNLATEPSEQHVGEEALESLIFAITFPVIAVASIVKCSISLIIRPISTLIQGFHPFDDDDEHRFYTVPTSFI